MQCLMKVVCVVTLALTGCADAAAEQDVCLLFEREGRHTIKVSAVGGTNIGAGVFQTSSTGDLTGVWYPVDDGDTLGVNLPTVVGDRFESVSASVYGNSGYTVTMSVRAHDDAFHVGQQLGKSQTSVAQNSLQWIVVVPLSSDNSGTEGVTTSTRGYFLQFRAHKLGRGDGGSLYVGPITVVTSAP